MKSLVCVVLLCGAAACSAQAGCSALEAAAGPVARAQQQLQKTEAGEMDTNVPPAAQAGLAQLKDALARAADAEVACAGAAADPVQLQSRLAAALKANPPEPGENTVQQKDDHRFDEASGGYGHNLRVKASRPAGSPALLEIEYRINIECGNDALLLVYEQRDGVWRQALRWQADKVDSIEKAFGDFFVSAVLPGAAGDAKGPEWRVAVAHGRPWCSSRFSGFKMDLLAPGRDAGAPTVLWHTERSYSRGDFQPRMKGTGGTFEMRVNRVCMDPAEFERRAIYRFRVDDDKHVMRVGPIAINARGFVEEWLASPWAEASDLSDGYGSAALMKVHAEFNPAGDGPWADYTYGPVRACGSGGVFQVEMDSNLDGKPLPGRYFHMREVKDGYLMLSAPATPDPACAGADLMPKRGN